MSVISIENLHLTYRGSDDSQTKALEDINLHIEEHEFVVVLGASGCGKTSLLNIMAGFLYQSRGEILLNNKQIKSPGPDRGVMFQKNALMPWLSVRDNICLGLKFQGVAKSEFDQICDKVLGWVQLNDFKDSYIYELSGGMQQRVGIARALASDPEILLMDEPLGALDTLTRQEIQQVILDVWKKTQKTVFMITHSIEEALLMATRLVIMTPHPGRVYKSYELSFSKQYINGEDIKSIKSSAQFLRIKEEIMMIVEGES